MVLANLNFHVAPMPPTKFWLNLTPIWEQMRFEDFGNPESLCRSDASHQVWTQSALRFGRRYHLKNFRMAAIVAILDVGIKRI